MFRKSWKLWGYAALMADARSMAALPRVRFGAGDEPIELRLRPLAGGAVWCRPGPSDFAVLYDAFRQRYHQPPAELGVPRTILDLGSNVGFTVAQMAAAFRGARILGVELDRGNYELCRRNTAAFGPRCTILWGAAWRENGEVSYDGPWQQAYRVVDGPRAGARRAPAHSVRSLIERFEGKPIDFLKMDVEGAEQEILPCAGEWIDQVRCLKIEIHRPYTVEACMADLRKLGLECRRGSDHPASVTAWNRAALEGAA